MFATRVLFLLTVVATSIQSSHSFAIPDVVASTLGHQAAPLVAAPLILATNAVPLQAAAMAVATNYNMALTCSPLATKLVTGGILALIGDALAQSRVATHSFDKKRAMSFAAFDVSYRNMQHYVFPWITRTFRGQYSGALFSNLGLLSVPGGMKMWSAVESTLFNQLVVTPALYYPTYFTVTALVQGMTFRQGVERAKSAFFPCFKRNLMFWLPLQFLQFRFVPPAFQIPVCCVLSLFWSMILSRTTAKAQVAGETTAAKGAVTQKRAAPTSTRASARALASMAREEDQAVLLAKKRLLIKAPWRRSIMRQQAAALNRAAIAMP